MKTAKQSLTNKDSEMLLASKNGNFMIVEQLLSNGAAIESRDENGFTSLILASRYGHAENSLSCC